MPAFINADPFTVTVNVSGAKSGTNYFRIDLYKEGTKNYFGETHNGLDWYSGSEGDKYFPVQDIGSAWSGPVQARIGAPSTNDYDGQGTYKMRVRRYTSPKPGSYNSDEASSSAVVVSLVIPTLTSVPSNTPTPTKTPTPTVLPTATKIPTAVPTAKPTLTPKPTTKPTESSQKTSSPTQKQNNPTVLPTKKEAKKAILAASTTAVKKSSPSAVPKTTLVLPTKSQQKTEIQPRNPFSFVFIALGVISLIVCGILIFQKLKNHEE